ncbi:MAG: TRAP transporter substrate-binding protein [Pseudomonadota bacterium]|nr:TRAP transporter substrate-binding protein [Pseudomonadota bacterium]
MSGRILIAGLTAAMLTLGSGCGGSTAPQTDTTSTAAPGQQYRWKMVTAWPKNFPGLGSGAEFLAATLEELSGGRLHVKVYGAGELVGAFEVFDAVSQGTAELGHSGAYYWKGKIEAAPFFSTIPFGLNAQEMNAWLYFGGGLELWREAYAPFNIIPFPAGNTGVQMGGWFNREINSAADLRGLKIRMPGLGGEVLARAGATVVNLPGGEIFTALQQGTIDATEWVGPYNDLAFGLHQAARYYYYPGWHEPGPNIELLVNTDAFNGLPDDLQAVIEESCKIANLQMLSEFTARNHEALRTLVDEHHVELRRFPDDVMAILRDHTRRVLQEQAERDPFSAKVYGSYSAFRDEVVPWHDISLRAYLNARARAGE